MNENSDQLDALLDKKEPFEISKKEISEIISPDNIASLKSYEIIDQIGGIKTLCEKLEVNPNNGLTTDDYFNSDNPKNQSKSYIQRKTIFGSFDPSLNSQEYKSFIKCFCDFFSRKVFLFIVILATLRMIIDQIYLNPEVFDYASLYLIFFIIGFSTAFTTYLIERLLYNFKHKIKKNDVRVLRNKEEKIISRSELLVGDIVIITSGDITVVDGIIIRTSALSIETKNGRFKKFKNLNYISDENIYSFPILLHGTKIIKGYGYLLVLNVECYENLIKRSNKIPHKDTLKINNIENVDDNNKYSLNESLLYENYTLLENKGNKSIETFEKKNNSEIHSTPIQKKLEYIYQITTYCGFIISFIITIFYAYSLFKNKSYDTIYTNEINFMFILIDCIFYFLILLCLIIPSGVELSFSLPLTFSILQLLKEKTIVKNASAYEYMAGLDNLFTDYYGILTQNKMKIETIFLEDSQVDKENLLDLKQLVSNEMFSFFTESISVNSIAFSAQLHNEVRYFGNNIECCLIRYLFSLDVNYRNFRNSLVRPIISSSPYLSESKLSYAVIKMDDKWEYVRLYLKGTPETLLDCITMYIQPGQVLGDFNKDYYDKIKMKIGAMYGNFTYPLILCYRDIPINDYNTFIQKNNNLVANSILEKFMNNLIFIALLGLKDEIKDNIENSIRKIKNAGIDIKLVTSLGIENSKFIAKKIGLLEKNDLDDDIILSSNRRNSKKNILEFLSEDQKFKQETFTESYLNLNKRNFDLNFTEAEEKKLSNINNYNSTNLDTEINKNLPKKKLITSKNIINSEDLKNHIVINYNEEQNTFTFNILNLDSFVQSINESHVIANASGKDKFVLISLLREKNQYIAVTGEGISDSIPMKASHVAIVLGENSNDISNESSDIILQDNNFNSIITTIVYGRNIFDCVRKFLQFQLSFIFSFVIMIIFTISPIVNVQLYHNKILYLNLIIDTFQAIALSSGIPQEKILLKKSPSLYASNQKLISNNLFIKICIQSIIQLIIYFIIIEISNINKINTILFNTIVYVLVFNAIVSKLYEESVFYQIKNFFHHYVFILIQGIIIGAQIFFVTFGNNILRIEQLTFMENFKCILISLLIFLEIPMINYMKENGILFKEEYFDKNRLNKEFSDLSFFKIKIRDENTENKLGPEYESLISAPKDRDIDLDDFI
jgi:magnesium-transporting ATPase (P-type)